MPVSVNGWKYVPDVHDDRSIVEARLDRAREIAFFPPVTGG